MLPIYSQLPSDLQAKIFQKADDGMGKEEEQGGRTKRREGGEGRKEKGIGCMEHSTPLLMLPIYSQLPSDLQAKIFQKADDGMEGRGKGGRGRRKEGGWREGRKRKEGGGMREKGEGVTKKGGRTRANKKIRSPQVHRCHEHCRDLVDGGWYFFCDRHGTLQDESL
jgi:hypothetical protein